MSGSNEEKCNWCYVSLVEQLVVNPEKAKYFEGFRYYRVEYYTPDSDYSDYECGIWLPAGTNPRDVEKLMNDVMKKPKEQHIL